MIFKDRLEGLKEYKRYLELNYPLRQKLIKQINGKIELLEMRMNYK